MGNNSFLSWNLNVWPNGFQTNTAGLLGNDSFVMTLASKDQIRHQAFAIGFFGFHYIRAANENEFSLQNESLQILRKLAMAHNLDTRFLRNLNVSKKQPYSDFWEDVLREISLTLGDSLGSEVQQMVEFGFRLAAIYACLVGVLKDSDSRKFAGQLGILKDWMSDLLMFAQQARISEMLLKPLFESRRLLRHSKTRRAAYKSMQVLELALRQLLLTEDTAGLIDENN